ncbi:MAG: type I-E CRISPR-associated protein Cse1/CasA, partial [Myxococcota bacterium]
MAAKTDYSLLDEPLLTVRSTDRKDRRQVNLPQLLSELPQEGMVGDFPRVTAHQRQAVHAFLVQLAVMALHRAGETAIEQSTERWRRMLVELADGEESAFALVVPDLSKPAFFQPPVPEGELKGWKTLESADALDILITAKSHDVKAHRASRAGPETWIFSLLTLQTMQGVLGAGNYGVVRMNSGFGNRPQVGLMPNLAFGARFARDVRLALDHREGLVGTDNLYPSVNGKTLLWLEPWDGKHSLALSECDPFFLEVCRRVRFTSRGDTLRCQSKSTKVWRVAAKAYRGAVGDLWTPVKDDGSALTVSASGFNYQRLQRLLTKQGFSPSAAQQVQTRDPEEILFVARALVRGQGKTEGFHERILHVPASMREHLRMPARLGRITQLWVEHAATVRTEVLKPALLHLVQGGPEKLDYRDKRIDPDLERFEAYVDARFFDALFAAVDHAG